MQLLSVAFFISHLSSMLKVEVLLPANSIIINKNIKQLSLNIEVLYQSNKKIHGSAPDKQGRAFIEYIY
ncbi:TPA: hypothetical protein ACSPJ7_005599 [Bacillus cereus]